MHRNILKPYSPVFNLLGVRFLANASRARQFNPLNPPWVGGVNFFSKVRVSILGLERIHQVTNTIRIANTGWRIYVFANTLECLINVPVRVFISRKMPPYTGLIWHYSSRDRNKEKCLHVRRTCDHVRLTCPPIFSHVQKIMHRSTQNYKFRKTGTIALIYRCVIRNCLRSRATSR